MTEPRTTAEQHRLLDEARRAALGKPGMTPDRHAEARRDVLLHGYRLFPAYSSATGRWSLSMAIVGALIVAAIIVAIVV